MSTSSSLSSSSSSSSDHDDDDEEYVYHYEHESDATGTSTGTGTTMLSWPAAEKFTSRLVTQEAIARLRAKYSIPEPWALQVAAGAACLPQESPASCVVYAGALEAGMRLPLHPFFAEALAHFGIAPGQLAPNGWRIMAGFVVLCHFSGVAGRPPLRVFCHLFALQALPKGRGWYFFTPKKGVARALFTGFPSSIKGWKEEFLVVTAPHGEPWRCPVRWGWPVKKAIAGPVTEQEAAVVRKLLHGHGVVDLKKYLCESNLVAAKISRAPAAAHGIGGASLRSPAPPSGKKANAAEAKNQELARAGTSAPSEPKRPELKAVKLEEGAAAVEAGEKRKATGGGCGGRDGDGVLRPKTEAGDSDLAEARVEISRLREELGKAKARELEATAEISRLREELGEAKARGPDEAEKVLASVRKLLAESPAARGAR